MDGCSAVLHSFITQPTIDSLMPKTRKKKKANYGGSNCPPSREAKPQLSLWGKEEPGGAALQISKGLAMVSISLPLQHGASHNAKGFRPGCQLQAAWAQSRPDGSTFLPSASKTAGCSATDVSAGQKSSIQPAWVCAEIHAGSEHTTEQSPMCDPSSP